MSPMVELKVRCEYHLKPPESITLSAYLHAISTWPDFVFQQHKNKPATLNRAM